MTIMLLLKKLRRAIIFTLFSANFLFANGENLNVPPFVNSLCLNCHSISSLDIRGGTSGGDLTKIVSAAKPYGSFENYINYKYGTSVDIFFLYPSKYVPKMAIVEGKLFTSDIQTLVEFLDTIPPEPKFILRWYHILVLVFIITLTIIIYKRKITWIQKKQ